MINLNIDCNMQMSFLLTCFANKKATPNPPPPTPNPPPPIWVGGCFIYNQSPRGIIWSAVPLPRFI